MTAQRIAPGANSLACAITRVSELCLANFSRGFSREFACLLSEARIVLPCLFRAYILSSAILISSLREWIRLGSKRTTPMLNESGQPEPSFELKCPKLSFNRASKLSSQQLWVKSESQDRELVASPSGKDVMRLKIGLNDLRCADDRWISFSASLEQQWNQITIPSFVGSTLLRADSLELSGSNLIGSIG